MLDFLTNTPNIKTLESALKVSNLRHQVITNNIANIDTPFFKRSEVEFESYLKAYLDEAEGKTTKQIPFDNKLDLDITNTRHISNNKKENIDTAPFLGATINTIDNQTMRTDGNNVDIDIEMANMAKNTIYYQAIAQRVGSYFNGLRDVIQK